MSNKKIWNFLQPDIERPQCVKDEKQSQDYPDEAQNIAADEHAGDVVNNQKHESDNQKGNQRGNHALRRLSIMAILESWRAIYPWWPSKERGPRQLPARD